MKQTDKVKEYLETHGSITDKQAYYHCSKQPRGYKQAYLKLGIRRLSARIWELRHEPYFLPIGTEYLSVKTKNGKAIIGRYYLIKETNNG